MIHRALADAVRRAWHSGVIAAVVIVTIAVGAVLAFFAVVLVGWGSVTVAVTLLGLLLAVFLVDVPLRRERE